MCVSPESSKGHSDQGDLNLEKGARLTAKISAANVTLGGELEGNVIASGQVNLLESAQLIGDLKASTLTVAAGSRMRGHVEFGWSASEAAKFPNGRAHEDSLDKKGRRRMKASRATGAGRVPRLSALPGDDSSERHVLSDLPPFTKNSLDLKRRAPALRHVRSWSKDLEHPHASAPWNINY